MLPELQRVLGSEDQPEHLQADPPALADQPVALVPWVGDGVAHLRCEREGDTGSCLKLACKGGAQHGKPKPVMSHKPALLINDQIMDDNGPVDAQGTHFLCCFRP